MVEDEAVRVRLTFAGDERPYLMDITSLFYDVELLYEFWLLFTAPDYADYRFTRFFWNRSGRRIRKEHRLRAGGISAGSPLQLEILVPLAVGGPAAAYCTLKVLRELRDWGPSREKQQLELEKLRRETKIAAIEEQRVEAEFERAIVEREAAEYRRRLLARLEDSPYTLEDIELLGARGQDGCFGGVKENE